MINSFIYSLVKTHYHLYSEYYILIDKTNRFLTIQNKLIEITHKPILEGN